MCPPAVEPVLVAGRARRTRVVIDGHLDAAVAVAEVSVALTLTPVVVARELEIVVPNLVSTGWPMKAFADRRWSARTEKLADAVLGVPRASRCTTTVAVDPRTASP